MDLQWAPEKIKHYKQASEYTAFHKKLAVLAQPYLDGGWSLADIGCGPGLLSFHLAPMVRHITAIDNNKLCIGALEAELDRIFYQNRAVAEKIEPRLMDARALGDERWDAILLAFFGANMDFFEEAFGHARERALIYTKARTQTPGMELLGAGGECTTPSGTELEAFLNERGYAYKKSAMEMQFGQPFKRIEDIHLFLAEVEGTAGEDAERRAADAEERIVKTNRFDFPYYLPRSVGVTLFIVAMKEAGA
ncbi:MAG: class I SAM-dependent methyltransferase [Clostridiales Family XIII bacterium]|nr:class I SAM-dependent methyltransferase [Clostridiales Family XIII bacterium]